MLDIIKATDKAKWNSIVCSMPEYDFYYLAEYHQLDSTGIPLLLHFKSSDISIVYPLILRDIKKTDYKDITSVYGYAGPLFSAGRIEDSVIKEFHGELLNFFDKNKIVSVFSRLHPLMPDQSPVLKGLGLVENSNLTVGLDLTLPQELQKKQYSRSLRTRINYLKRKGIKISKATTDEEVGVFIDIYRENMERVKAAKKYFFPEEYFYTFVKNIDSFILLATLNGEYISGALFTECNGILQAHLNMTKTDYLHLSPLKLVLDEGRQIGIHDGMRFMHLGGGFGGNNDSLFMFKSRFSKLYLMFRTWKYIHNEKVYEELSGVENEKIKKEIAFFPLYRVDM